MQESIDDVDKVILVSNLLLNNGQTPLQKQNITDHNRYNVDKKREKKNENEMKWNTVELQQIYMQNLICITKQIPQYKRTFVQVIVALRQSKNTISLRDAQHLPQCVMDSKRVSAKWRSNPSKGSSRGCECDRWCSEEMYRNRRNCLHWRCDSIDSTICMAP